jgi:hypothetical protein
MNNRSPYSSCSIAALAKLLNKAACGSAEQRVIRDELRRREIESKPNTEQPVIFTATEWAQTEKRYCPAKPANDLSVFFSSELVLPSCDCARAMDSAVVRR